LNLQDPPALEIVAEHRGPPLAREQPAKNIRVEHVPAHTRIHLRATAVGDVDQPSLLEPPNTLARDAATHAKLLGQIDFSRKPVTRAIATACDLADQHAHRFAMESRHASSRL